MEKLHSLKLGALLALGLGALNTIQAAVTISEVMPANIGTYMNELYEYSGYVELHNDGTTDVDLKGYYLTLTTDGVAENSTINYSLTVKAGGYKLLYYDKKDSIEGHLSQKMDPDGAALVLYNGSGSQVSALTYPALPAYLAYGVNGSTTGYMLPTPAAANSDAYVKYSVCATPTFGTKPGLFSDATSGSTAISCSQSGATIYYTTDGTLPSNTHGTKYTGEIAMSKNTVLRAIAYVDGYLPSAINTASYLFKDDAHSYCGGFTVPIVSIVSDPANFTNDTIGMATIGTNGISSGRSCLTGDANYNQDWHRPVNFEFIKDGSSVFNQEVEASIMGGCSRGYDVKSLKLASNKKCGTGKKKMKYAFFDDRDISKYKSVHLRNGGNAYNGIRFRDGFMQTLIQKTGIDYQSYRPVAYYLNGVYQGFIGLRERMNEDYLWSHYDLDEDDLDVITVSDKGSEASCGTLDGWNNLMTTCKESPTDSGYYSKMNQLMDINEYLDYMIFEQFIVNTDWPSNNNKMWRKNTNNGRFRWMIYDTDFGFGLYGGSAPNYTSYTTDMIQFSLGEGSVVNWGNGASSGDGYAFTTASNWKVLLFKSLMQNPEFKSKYLMKSLIHLNTDLSTSHIKTVWDSISADAESEFCASHSPNEYYKYTYGSDDEVTTILTFAEKRPGYVYDYLASYYGGSLIDLKINSNIANAKWDLNGVRWDSSEYNSKYVRNNTLTVLPIAPANYTFDHWELSSSPSAVLLNDSSEWRYFYDSAAPSGSWTENSYDDSDWKTGKGKFGYGSSTDYTTTLDYGDSTSNKYITSYYRTDFTVSDKKQFSKLTVNLTYDDGVVIYLNGKEVKRINLSDSTAIDYSSLATTYVNDATSSFDIDSSYLQQGINVLAVEVHQNSVSSSDMTFKLNLTGVGCNTSTTSTTKLYSATVTDNLTLKAIFKADDSPLPLLLNEICSSNNSEGGYADEYDNYGDFVEIYNNSNEAIDLGGMYLSDNAANLQKYQIPTTNSDVTTLPAKGHKIIWCDGETWQGELHAGFKLSMGTKTKVILSRDNNGSVETIDTTSYPALLGTNETYGRSTDAASDWIIFIPCDSATQKSDTVYAPTPGEANGTIRCHTAGIEEVATHVEPQEVNIYPNPVEEELNIDTKEQDLKEINIYNLSGSKVYTQTASGRSYKANLRGLASGVYTLQIQTDKTLIRLKFIKK